MRNKQKHRERERERVINKSEKKKCEVWDGMGFVTEDRKEE